MSAWTREEKEIVQYYTDEIVNDMKNNPGPGINTLSQISTHLFVSNWRIGSDVQKLSEKKIKHALCLTERSTRNLAKRFEKKRISLTVVPLPRDHQTDISSAFRPAWDFVRSIIEKSEKLVIFCDDGMTLAPLVAAVYLVYSYYLVDFTKKGYKSTVDSDKSIFSGQIVKFVKQSRPCIMIPQGFVQQLVVFELMLKRKYKEMIDGEKKKIRKLEKKELRGGHRTKFTRTTETSKIPKTSKTFKTSKTSKTSKISKIAKSAKPKNPTPIKKKQSVSKPRIIDEEFDKLADIPIFSENAEESENVEELEELEEFEKLEEFEESGDNGEELEKFEELEELEELKESKGTKETKDSDDLSDLSDFDDLDDLEQI